MSDDKKVADKLARDDVNHFASMFTKYGTRLLETTERPNIITLAEFMPYKELYNMDRRRASDASYIDAMLRLFSEFKKRYSLNIYFPTIVIESRENPKEVHLINRTFIRIKDDHLDDGGKSENARKTAMPSMAGSREAVILRSSLDDIGAANGTPEQISYFNRMRLESVMIASKNKFLRGELTPTEGAVKKESPLPVLDLGDDWET